MSESKFSYGVQKIVNFLILITLYVSLNYRTNAKQSYNSTIL